MVNPVLVNPGSMNVSGSFGSDTFAQGVDRFKQRKKDNSLEALGLVQKNNDVIKKRYVNSQVRNLLKMSPEAAVAAQGVEGENGYVAAKAAETPDSYSRRVRQGMGEIADIDPLVAIGLTRQMTEPYRNQSNTDRLLGTKTVTNPNTGQVMAYDTTTNSYKNEVFGGGDGSIKAASVPSSYKQFRLINQLPLKNSYTAEDLQNPDYLRFYSILEGDNAEPSTDESGRVTAGEFRPKPFTTIGSNTNTGNGGTTNTPKVLKKAPISATQQTEMDEAVQTSGTSQVGSRGYDRSYVGPINSRAHQAKNLTGSGDAGYNNFVATLGADRLQKRNELFGAALSKAESADFMAVTADPSQNYTEFEPKFNSDIDKQVRYLKVIENRERAKGNVDFANRAAAEADSLEKSKIYYSGPEDDAVRLNSKPNTVETADNGKQYKVGKVYFSKDGNKAIMYLGDGEFKVETRGN